MTEWNIVVDRLMILRDLAAYVLGLRDERVPDADLLQMLRDGEASAAHDCDLRKEQACRWLANRLESATRRLAFI